MSNQELAISLLEANTEQEVIEILKTKGYWDDPGAWKFYGGKENNFATIGNQKSKAEDALVEKLINSVDAVLMGEAKKQGIDPESDSAPQSISQALNDFYGIYNGKLSNLSPGERTKLAENIALIATGAKSKPCYTIVDKGEGQSPVKLKDTILSIDKNNKLRTPFVQGKFNMGGTAVLRFCGVHNLQLVISKRHPELAKQENDKTGDKWGVTVVRRENPPSGVRSSIYKYLAPNGSILTFAEKKLMALPGKYPEPYSAPLEWGTVIKLYEYQMTGLKTNILFDLNYKLALLMPSLALPIRLYERRKGYTGHTMETTLSGLSVRLEEDKKENLEEGFPTSSPITAMGQRMTVSIFAFKPDKAKKYTKEEGIVFTINGQTHGILSKAFFTRQSVKLGYIAKSLLITVDCTELDGRSREDLFLNSRDRLAQGELRNQIEKELEILFREHNGLKKLRERRRQQDIENKIQDSRPLQEVIEDILKKSPTLSRLFVKGIRLPNPFNFTKSGTDDHFDGKRFPSFFSLSKSFNSDNPKTCPRNSRFRVQFKTDVENDYFDRDSDPGSFILKVNGSLVDNKQINPWNGTVNLNVRLPEQITVGDVLHYTAEVSDVSLLEPFKSEFYVEVTEELVKGESSHKEGDRQKPPGDNSGKPTESNSQLAIPRVIPVHKGDSNWVSKDFTDETALFVIDSGEDGYDYYINKDNIHLLTELKGSKAADAKVVHARYEFGMVLIGISLLKDFNDREAVEKDGMDISNIIKSTTRIISPILLPMIENLGDIQVEDVEQSFEAELV